MKVLVIGSSGQVGFELLRTLQPLGDVRGLHFPEVDLADPDSVRALLRDRRPDIAVNAAAYTAVDNAESEPEKAMAINGIAQTNERVSEFLRNTAYNSEWVQKPELVEIKATTRDQKRLFDFSVRLSSKRPQDKEAQDKAADPGAAPASAPAKQS